MTGSVRPVCYCYANVDIELSLAQQRNKNCQNWIEGGIVSIEAPARIGFGTAWVRWQNTVFDSQNKAFGAGANLIESSQVGQLNN